MTATMGNLGNKGKGKEEDTLKGLGAKFCCDLQKQEKRKVSPVRKD